METRTQRVVLETQQHQIIGDVTLPREGYLSRFSDFLNQSEVTFVAITNVTVVKKAPGGPPDAIELPFIAVGISHIEIAYPDE